METAHQAMAQLIFDVLSGKGHQIYMYDPKGNQVFDSKQANRFWSNDEKLMVSLGYTKGKPPRPLCTFYTSDVTNLDRFNDIKFSLKKHNPYDFSFDTEHFSRTLEPKHFKHMNVTEQQKWSGSTRTSYLPVDGVSVVIKHTRPWHKDTLDQAQRWRRIRQVMLHTPNGERFEFPYHHVLGAKAMAQHLNHQNQMHDRDGALIMSLVGALMNLGKLGRRARRVGSEMLCEEITSTRHQLKKLLRQISEARTYETALATARKMITDWNKPFALKTSQPAQPVREARELQRWFDSFSPTLVETDSSREEVFTAWQASNKNKYRTLDYLKRNHPGWRSRFEADPESVTDEITQLIAEFENEEN